MAAIQAGADLKFTNNRKQNALAVAEACGFDLGVELLRKANVDSKKDARDRKLGKRGTAGHDGEKKTTEEDVAKAQAAADELLASEAKGAHDEAGAKEPRKKKKRNKKKSAAKAGDGGGRAGADDDAAARDHTSSDDSEDDARALLVNSGRAPPAVARKLASAGGGAAGRPGAPRGDASRGIVTPAGSAGAELREVRRPEGGKKPFRAIARA